MASSWPARLVLASGGWVWLWLGKPGPGWAWLAVRSFQGPVGGPGWAWLGLAGPGWAWLVLSGPDWSWLVLAGPGWSCLVLAVPGWSWLVLAGFAGPGWLRWAWLALLVKDLLGAWLGLGPCKAWLRLAGRNLHIAAPGFKINCFSIQIGPKMASWAGSHKDACCKKSWPAKKCCKKVVAGSEKKQNSMKRKYRSKISDLGFSWVS